MQDQVGEEIIVNKHKYHLQGQTYGFIDDRKDNDDYDGNDVGYDCRDDGPEMFLLTSRKIEWRDAKALIRCLQW